MSEARAVGLLGARQVGKSTLARALAEGDLPAGYVTLDVEATHSLAADDPTGFVAGLDTPVVIDEIQRLPELLVAIKARVDRDNAPGQFLITGSANLRRLPTISDALPGRVDYLTLWPFTQGELDGRRDRFLPSLFAANPPWASDPPGNRSGYADRLLTGGFPEAARRSERGRLRFFDGYLSSIIGRDIVETSRVHDPAAVGDLLRLIAARSGSIARYQRLGSELGLDGKTIKSYVDVLERIYLIRVRRPWHVNLGKRQVRAPKLYVADTGLLAGLVGVDSHRFGSDPDVAGSIVETFVATELERQASWFGEPLTFWHYREGEREVDVIIERPSGEIIGVEVKAGATVRPRDVAGLRHLQAKVGERMRAGVVLYTGDQVIPFGARLWALPLAALWGRRGPDSSR